MLEDNKSKYEELYRSLSLQRDNLIELSNKIVPNPILKKAVTRITKYINQIDYLKLYFIGYVPYLDESSDNIMISFSNIKKEGMETPIQSSFVSNGKTYITNYKGCFLLTHKVTDYKFGMDLYLTDCDIEVYSIDYVQYFEHQPIKLYHHSGGSAIAVYKNNNNILVSYRNDYPLMKLTNEIPFPASGYMCVVDGCVYFAVNYFGIVKFGS